MTSNYHIGKGKYLYVVTDYNARGEPNTSKREDPEKVTPELYITTSLGYLGFPPLTIEEAKVKCPYTVQYLDGVYRTLYLNEDVELDEDIIRLSLREVGRAQKELGKPR